jgi:cytoskeleton protein RodZ
LAKTGSRTRPTIQDDADNHGPAEQESALHHSSQGKEALGVELKAARLERKVTLQRVAQDTRISLRHLQSLEEGQYQNLPGGMYNRAFLRSYCAYLGLDPGSLLTRYEQESEPHGDKMVKVRAPSPNLSREPFRFPPVLVWSLMFLASVIGLWFSRRWISAVFSPYFSRPPATRMETHEPNPPAAQQHAGEPALVGAPTPAIPTSTPPVEATAASVSAQASLERPVTGAIQLRLDAVESCWISVTGDGKRMLYKLLQPGEGQSFAADTSFDIILGNAGGVKLKINGKPVRSLGPSGSVIRFTINPQNISDLLEKLTG